MDTNIMYDSFLDDENMNDTRDMIWRHLKRCYKYESRGFKYKAQL
jgi:hypothetical protein